MAEHSNGLPCNDAHCLGHRPTRRGILGGGLALAGAGAMLPMSAGRVQAAVSKGPAHRLDVHCHIVSPEIMKTDTNPAQKSWTIEASLGEMDRSGIATGIASAPSSITPAQVRPFNEYGARVMGDHKGRFGLFAPLPLPNIDDSLKEIAYALDVLKADGIGLFTNYGNLWLGDKTFRPVFEELNRRKAVVYVHPADAPCCTPMSYQIPPVAGSWIEWPMNTARAILSLMLNKVMLSLPDIRFIFAHDGGAMPMMVGRIAGLGQSRRPDFVAKFKDFFPNGIEAEYRKIYFDTAQGYNPVNFEAMRKLVPDSHILFGTDYPYFSMENSVAGLLKLNLKPSLLAKIERSNAEALLPRWKKA